MRVWVSGGTGFVGTAVVDRLVGAGHEVVALAHDRTPPARPGVTVVRGDVRTDGPWASSLEGCDAVIHLVAIIRERVASGATFEAMHVGATHRVVRAATRAGVRRFVHVSALGVGRTPGSRYMETKERAEGEVAASGLDATILRPSFIFADRSPFFDMLAGLARGPVTPVVGPGTVPFQPVARAEVVEAAVRSLDRPGAVGKTYELGGPDIVTYREMLDLLAPRPVRAVHLPIALVRAVTALLEAAPAFPLTLDQLVMLGHPNLARDDAWRADLSLTSPVSFVGWAAARTGRPA